VRSQKRIRWLDASGFRLAVSAIPEDFPTGFRQPNDYDLLIENGEVSVVRIF
jgi:hypothetical protein